MPFQSLSLVQQQRQMMILAPQLRQSLEMLQLPLLELRALIQKEMEQNPTIEEVETPQELSLESLAQESRTAEMSPEIGATPDDAPAEAHEALADDAPLDFGDTSIDTLKALDNEWREYYFEEQRNQPYTSQDEERRRYMFDSLQQPISLQNHLLAQLGLTTLTPEDKRLGELIIGNINDHGYLTASLPELAYQTTASVARLEEILQVVQEMDPSGIGARDLRECLLLQLAQSDDAAAGLAAAIIDRHLEELAAHKYLLIAQSLNATPADVEKAATLIRTLNPHPGSLFAANDATYVTPEIFVERNDEGQWEVALDDNQLPHIRISNHYRKLLESHESTPEVKSYIRERIRSGAFLVKSINQRQRTIHMIASEIVAAQQEFLNEGVSALRPMTMAEVADKVGVHETTVSRTVANKYMQTPIGLFELKYFFTPGLKTADGSTISNKTVQDMIETMITEESPTAPLSDQAIQKHLKENGIKIARRTVAKYRMLLKIPPSHLRKRGR